MRARSHRVTRSLALAALVAAATAFASSASADEVPAPRVHPPVTAEGREAARKFADKGYEQYEAGDCKAARASFEAAEERFHAPPHLLFIARCDAKLGQLMAARALFKEVLDEKLAADAPPPFVTAQGSAKSELDEIEIRLPSVEIAIRAGESGPIVVTLDGAPVPASAMNKARPIDPGSHTVAAKSGSGLRFARTFDAKDGGGATRVEISFGDAAPSGSLVPAFIAFGVGAVGVGFGVVTGVGSISKVSDLKTACPNNQCSPSQQPTADAAKTLGTLSTIGFIVGGVGAASGITLLVVRPTWFTGDAPKDSTSPQAPRVSLSAAPGALRLSGSF
jgi:hypothetical protein